LILVDTGPLIALFDPRDKAHSRCREILKLLREALFTTVPVLTEAFHMLSPASIGSERLRDFILNRGMSVWFFTDSTVTRGFELMEQYADQPMDLADASLVVACEALETRKIFTIDRRDFETYRLKRGHRHITFDIIH
jgi:hypothetical protein